MLEEKADKMQSFEHSRLLPLTCVSDELSSILKKLSLEKYQPIFEEQEVVNLQSEGNSKS